MWKETRFTPDIEWICYKKIFENARDYEMTITTAGIQIYLREALLNKGGYIPFFDAKNEYK